MGKYNLILNFQSQVFFDLETGVEKEIDYCK